MRHAVGDALQLLVQLVEFAPVIGFDFLLLTVAGDAAHAMGQFWHIFHRHPQADQIEHKTQQHQKTGHRRHRRQHRAGGDGHSDHFGGRP
ncbi:hypothetical protein [Limnohabitans sp.]|uniref:hypothetical protein n=1 Tax=Limnohabitans sp. TaxID=1907725 RepID=UPI00334016E0